MGSFSEGGGRLGCGRAAQHRLLGYWVSKTRRLPVFTFRLLKMCPRMKPPSLVTIAMSFSSQGTTVIFAATGVAGAGRRGG